MTIEWPDELTQFLERPVPIYMHVAAATTGMPPFACRGYGFRAEPERDRLWIYIVKNQWPRLHGHLQQWLAALLTSGVDNESYQLKGTWTDCRNAGSDDQPFLDKQRAYTYRYFPHLVPMLSVSPADCLAVSMQVRAVYVQTPGPRAGMLLVGEGE